MLTIVWLGEGTSLQAARDENVRREPARKPQTNTAVEPSRKQEVERLITQLGDEQYLKRRSAELRLIELSADAFDQLQAAETHPDLEIATRARYILHRIRIQWVRPDDSAEVQAIMHLYEDLSFDERLDRIDQLQQLGAPASWGPLCRIARYDPSPLLARQAALVVLRSLNHKAPQSAADAATLLAELEDSKRVPAAWILQYAVQLKQPDRIAADWLPLIAAEVELIKQQSEETDASIAINLIQFHLELCAHYAEHELAFKTLQHWVEMANFVDYDTLDAEGLVSALRWLIDNQQWQALELLEAHYAEQIRSSRQLLYLAAIARSKQSKQPEAEEFAEQAFRLPDDDAESRYQAASEIANLGHHDWAEREWKYLVETLPVLDDASRNARESLATLRLHDRGEHQAAAELLAVYCDEFERQAAANKGFVVDQYQRGVYQSIAAQRDYFFACHAEEQGDFDQQRKYLDLAIKAHPLNADIAIAMYRLQNADDAYRKKTLTLIRRSCEWLEGNIQQSPDQPNWYNHWAWLVSNTEGDYAKAVEFSQRSLELSPGSPSYLDTLGRCYYAAGELENAVKTQRQAVEGHPHLMVMRRQLELFERELAEQNKSP